MTNPNGGVPIERPLNDDERQLLADLAVKEVAKQANCTPREASVVLAKMAADGELFFIGDNTSVKVCNSAGGFFVSCARDWLAFESSFGKKMEGPQ